MTIKRWFLPISALIAVLAVAIPLTSGATQRLGESPHDRADRCQSCHTTTEAGAVGAPLPTLTNCLTCHPDADMHPVGMAPEHVPVPAGWPLEDGKVTCATCHAEPSCDASRERAAPWLRGGTPAKKVDFCYRCHEAKALTRKSPHPAPNVDPGQAGCPACHSARPQTGASVAQSGLLSPPAEACATCHPGPAHVGVAEHVGAVQDIAALSPEAARALPLGEGGVIGCWTCHDMHIAPHPAAPTSKLAVALGGAEADPHEALLALPVGDGSLCKACHGEGP